MHPPPAKIDGASVLAWAPTSDHTKTNACTFRRDGEEQLHFAGIALARYEGDGGFYLFFCDENWETQNDTLHFREAEAREFAESLYPGVNGLWQPAGR